MRCAKHVVLLGLLAAAATAGAALSADGASTTEAVNVCVHQNGGALVASASCGANDTAVSLLTTSGTAANSQLLDGRSASQFVQSGLSLGNTGGAQPGYVRLDCENYLNVEDVQIANLGTMEFSCGPRVSILSDQFVFGLFQESHDPTFVTRYGVGVKGHAHPPLSIRLDAPTHWFGQVREDVAGAPTVTIEGSIVAEDDPAGSVFDILYSVTEN